MSFLATRKTSMSAEDHIRKGRANGIPECCIQWWIAREDCPKWTTAQALAVEAGWNYVPCPECAASGNRAHVHRCDNLYKEREQACTVCGYFDLANHL